MIRNTRHHNRAIAFDFDGTLISGGIVKGVHIVYSSWVACYENGFRAVLHPANVNVDVRPMIEAFSRYPGAPRFQQLAAVVNMLVNGVPEAFADPKVLGDEPDIPARYERVRAAYNRQYSELNDAAARRYWRPWPGIKDLLKTLASEFDLYVASGVTQDLLEKDLATHRFDLGVFRAVAGCDPRGGNDKGEILRGIRSAGYEEMLFVGDSQKDLEYALSAGAKFFRIRNGDDFSRLVEALRSGAFPHEDRPWTLSEEERRFLLEKAGHLLRQYVAGQPLSPEAAADCNHEPV